MALTCCGAGTLLVSGAKQGPLDARPGAPNCLLSPWGPTLVFLFLFLLYKVDRTVPSASAGLAPGLLGGCGLSGTFIRLALCIPPARQCS